MASQHPPSFFRRRNSRIIRAIPAKRRALAAEGAVLLAKPFSPDDLLAAVNQRLDKTKA